mmetsp:Transcript_17963/g.38327  ORF Transcript_17963/g.38327 Transcript_17963/m.38327 type:complete len:928 (-) Transcript_17963:109-2892(-)
MRHTAGQERSKRCLRLRTVPRCLAGALLATSGVVSPCRALPATDEQCLLQTSVLSEASLSRQVPHQIHGVSDQERLNELHPDQRRDYESYEDLREDDPPCGAVPTAHPCKISWEAEIVGPLDHEVARLARVRRPEWLRHGLFPPVREEGEAPGTTAPEVHHKVQHVAVLNKAGVWVLMFVVIVAMAAAVVKMDTEVDQAAIEDAVSEKQASFFQRWKPHLHMLITAIALNGAMVCWGISQEYLMTTEYMRKDGPAERMPSSIFLTLANRVFTVISSFVVLKMNGTGLYFSGTWICCVPSFTNSVSSWLQYQSLAYVSFPLQCATKSAKLLPVMMISTLRGKKQKLSDYIEAIVIVVAIAVFAIEVEGAHHDVSRHLKVVGFVMLVIVLFVDSTTPHMQDTILQKYPEMTVMQMSFTMACISCVMLFIFLCAKGELLEAFRFFNHFPLAWLHLVVLSFCSTIQQILIPYTIRHFGPVVFVVMITFRQLISMLVSACMFGHAISVLAWLAACLASCTVIKRALRPVEKEKPERPPQSEDDMPEQDRGHSRTDGDAENRRKTSVLKYLRSMHMWNVFLCMLGVHVPLALYSITQEFMSVHYWNGDLFHYSMFLIAMNRTLASIFAVCLLKVQGITVLTPSLKYALIPAACNLSATYCQYRALHFLAYPMQSLIKTFKVVPVMLVGRVLGTRTYKWIDYVEATMITMLAGFFAWNFNRSQREFMGKDSSNLLAGIWLMVGYIFSDCVTSNSEDLLYQRYRLDPAHMLLGMQFIAGMFSWTILLCDGQLFGAIRFIHSHEEVWIPILVLAAAEAAGSYACTITVRLFGPAVFTLILMSHQMVSLLISVFFFSHPVTILCAICLGAVAMVTLTAAGRQALEKDSKVLMPRPASSECAGDKDHVETLKATNQASPACAEGKDNVEALKGPLKGP